jgi:polar amino acid transport system substrate-binding protein
MPRRPASLTALASVAALSVLCLGACSQDPTTGAGAQTNKSAGSGKIAAQKVNSDLREQLPQQSRSVGKMTSVNTGSFPPYVVVESGNKVSGATADLATALGQLLGVKIQHTTIDGLASVLSGMDAKRYSLDLGPIGDFTDRQQQATFVDWVQEFVVFAVRKGNPMGIEDLASTCGTSIAVQAAGSAEEVIKTQAKKCVAAGKKPVDVQSYKDQPSSILAVQSGRADAFFSSQAPLTYFVKQSHGKLELAGTGHKNGFDDLYQGIVVPKDSKLADVMLKAMQELFDNGTYKAIMAKWGLQANMLDKPGINLGK